MKQTFNDMDTGYGYPEREMFHRLKLVCENSLCNLGMKESFNSLPSVVLGKIGMAFLIPVLDTYSIMEELKRTAKRLDGSMRDFVQSK